MEYAFNGELFDNMNSQLEGRFSEAETSYFMR